MRSESVPASAGRAGAAVDTKIYPAGSVSRSPQPDLPCAEDWAFAAAAWAGILLSAIVVVGLADRCTFRLNAVVWFGISLLYIPFVNVGQTLYQGTSLIVADKPPGAG
jgi:hypothetical protein